MWRLKFWVSPLPGKCQTFVCPWISDYHQGQSAADWLGLGYVLITELTSLPEEMASPKSTISTVFCIIQICLPRNSIAYSPIVAMSLRDTIYFLYFLYFSISDLVSILVPVCGLCQQDSLVFRFQYVELNMCILPGHIQLHLATYRGGQALASSHLCHLALDSHSISSLWVFWLKIEPSPSLNFLLQPHSLWLHHNFTLISSVNLFLKNPNWV